MMEDYAEMIPRELHRCSGAVFNAGRLAFQSPSDLYVLELHPRGNPAHNVEQTVWWQVHDVLYNLPDNWSVYRDQGAAATEPGLRTAAPRMLHLLEGLGLNPGKVPASHLIFMRSRSGNQLPVDLAPLVDRCWPMHQAVIEELGVKAVLCLGRQAGERVRERLGAYQRLVLPGVDAGDAAPAQLFRAACGRVVVVLEHPAVSDWTDPKRDPTAIVRRALDWGISGTGWAALRSRSK